MKIIIDSNEDTPGSVLTALSLFRRVFEAASASHEMAFLATEQRADLPALRTRVDNETASTTAARAAFSPPNENSVLAAAHDPHGADDHIPAAAPVVAAVTPYPMPVAVVHTPAVPPPPAPVAAPVVPAAGVALDVQGLPWDARIHASTKTKVANGEWKKKKGLDPAVIATVVAELRAVMGLPAVAASALTPGIPSTPAALAAAAPPPPAPVPVPPVAAVPVPPPAPPTGAITTFAGLMSYISAQVVAGKWSHPETLTACQASGVTALPLLASRPDLIPAVAATIQAMIAAKG